MPAITWWLQQKTPMLQQNHQPSTPYRVVPQKIMRHKKLTKKQQKNFLLQQKTNQQQNSRLLQQKKLLPQSSNKNLSSRNYFILGRNTYTIINPL